MFCSKCGKEIDENSTTCAYCLAPIGKQPYVPEDKSSFGDAVLGFFIPIVGLILYLVYHNNKPKQAKSAGKGALIGFTLRIILIILYFVFVMYYLPFVYTNKDTANVDTYEKMVEETLAKEVDVTFGEFTVTEINGSYKEAKLDVTVKNKSETRKSISVEIEAVDENGARIGTSDVYAYDLNAGQEIYLEAFDTISQDEIEQYTNATFKVLNVIAY